MKLNINICTDTNCTIKVVEEKSDSYLPESSVEQAFNRFKYSDTVSIDVLQLNKISGEEIYSPVISLRGDSSHVSLPVTFDGWFNVCHLVIPNHIWFNQQLNSSNSSLGLYSTVYYSDGEQIYKYFNNKSEIVPISELILRNPEGTTISIVKKDYVSICHLKQCYLNICYKLFKSQAFGECFSSNIDCELKYKRDLVWMAINVIQYMVEDNQLAEAQRIITELEGCNGVCKQTEISNKGCGCS